MREAPEIEVATLAKNSREQIRIRLNEYRGAHYADVRVFTPFGDDDEPKPTKKGVAVNVSKLDELIMALGRAKAEAIRLGYLLNDGGTGTS